MTMAENIVKEHEDVEMAQVKEEFSRMRGLAPGVEVPEDIIKVYKRYEKQRSMLDVQGPIGLLEKILLSIMYDMFNGDLEPLKPAIEGMEAFSPPVPVEPEDDFNAETHEYKEGDSVSVMHEGIAMLGTYVGKSAKKLHIKVGGDGANFRKKDRSEVKPYKD